MSYINSHQAQIDDAVEAHRRRYYEGLVKEAQAANEAKKAFAEMFPGETHAVYVVSYWQRGIADHSYRSVAQDIFPANISKDGVNRGLQDARETFADEDEPSYSKACFINCIEILPNGQWKPVQLFRSE